MISAVDGDEQKYYMFVTSNNYNGGQVGGIAGANEKCNIESPTKDYKAYISTNGQYPGASIGMNPNYPIYRTDNVMIANNLSDLEDGTLNNSILKWVLVWTGIGDSSKDCSNWESATGFGIFGRIIDELNGGWATYGSSNCGISAQLYCVGPFAGEEAFYCGDGIKQTWETCDSGANNGNYGYCKRDCSGLGPYCTDGICQRAYENYSLCSNDCESTCGDEFCASGENCSSCTSDCGRCGEYYLFVSAWKGKGGDVQNIYNASNICNSDINKPTGDKSGTYKAYLGNGQAWWENQNFNPRFSIKRASDNALIALNYIGFKTGIIQNPITLTPKYYWTGLGGIFETSIIYDCNGWSSSNVNIQGWSGCGEYASTYYVGCGISACSDTKSLLCIGPLDYCGDDICSLGLGETYLSCFADCGKYGYCGDGICKRGETCSSCASDCGACSVVTPGDRGSSGGGGGSGGGGSSGGSGTIIIQTPKIYSPTNDKISEGYIQSIIVGDKINLNFPVEAGFEEHTITINKIESNLVQLTIQSEPVIILLSKGDEKKLSITSEEYYDLYLKLENIYDSKADLTIKLIHEEKEKQKVPLSTNKKSALIAILITLVVIFAAIALLKKSVKKKRKLKN